MRKRLLAITIALGASAVPFAAVAAPAGAATPPPGQCKQVNGNCHGGSEFAPPHCEEFSPGQQKKLGC